MSDDLYDQGMQVRRAVLGDGHVDRALSGATDFTRAMQDHATAHCWGTVWQREALPRQTRSLITLALLTSLRATTELQGHVRGALRNGCSVAEIREVLLHASVYCGVPAGIEAFRAAGPAIEAWENGERD
jgi:4-carboxymuconolactone decarboxylase